MKQLIISMAIIVALIAFFVIADHREFNRYDAAVQTVQSENPIANRKPSGSVPESKPEAKPSVTTKPAAEVKQNPRNKPVAEAKNSETKPVERKIRENSEEKKPVPVAVPVLSPEEAEIWAEKRERDREEAKNRGWVFYEERFDNVRNASSNIQQTINWLYVPQDGKSNTSIIAKKMISFL